MTPPLPHVAIWNPREGGRVAGMTREQLLEGELEDSRQRLRSFQEMTYAVGIVCGIQRKDGALHASLLVGGHVIEKKLGAWAEGVVVGMQVRCTNEGAQPVAFTEAPAVGVIAKVERIHPDGAVEFSHQNQSRLAACGFTCQIGDRVLLDQNGVVVIKNLGSVTAASVYVAPDEEVDWNDIGGLAEAKQKMREAIEEPILHAELYKSFGQKPCKGIALHGPPGCGKTMLARAAATALAKLHGKSARAGGYIYVKGPELLHGIVGSSEGNVRALFAAARVHFLEHGYPAIIFLDEADGLLAARGRTPWEGMERTVVPQFLAEMDGLNATHALVMLATNRPDNIDPAFMRDGRIDLKIEITRPTKLDCVDIFVKCIGSKPTHPDGAKALAIDAAEELFSDRHVLDTTVSKANGRERIGLSSIVSGAMVAGIVQRGTQRALRRAIATPKTKRAMLREDLSGAIADVLKEELGLAGKTKAASESRLLHV